MFHCLFLSSLFFLLGSASAASNNPNLQWLTTYDFSPNVTHGWQNLVSGDGATFDDMIQAYKEYGMNAMPQVPKTIWDLENHGLAVDWEAQTEAFVADLVPYIKSGMVAGIFLGDELCTARPRLALSNFTLVIDKLRGLIGPRDAATQTPFLYANENAQMRDWAMVPASLDYISIDRYNTPNTNGTAEVVSVHEYYTGTLYPRLHPHQAVFLVPGIYANDPYNCEKGNVSCPVKDQEAQVVIKLEEYFKWAQEDEKIVGFNPWHFNDRNASQYVGVPYDYRLGAVSMPTVVDKLKEIGTFIINNN